MWEDVTNSGLQGVRVIQTFREGNHMIHYNSSGSSDASTQENQLQRTGRKRVQATADWRNCGERKPSLPGRKNTMV